MFLGRCGISTFRYASELPKKRCGGNPSAGSYLIRVAFLPTSTWQQHNRICRNSSFISPFSARMASTSTGDHKSKDKEAEKKNRLAFEKSPYLLQHASNPVDWYPWGEEALEKAKKEDKMIFLSVGYSTCHWCHVMEKESFKNIEIARIMNQYFVNIKVDREERPDIDRIYMTFVQAISGHGGWPMSVFLSPDLKPIIGGTYFPPEDTLRQSGFKTVLLNIAEKWKQLKTKMLESGSTNLKTLQEIANAPHKLKIDQVPLLVCKDICIQQLADEFEPNFGGFGGTYSMQSPKFPQPVNFNFLFHMYGRDPTGEHGQNCLHMCIHSLTKMAQGGIHDHVGQGFSRYATDGEWHVPHFEKMLYDQGQLMQSYADAFLATNETFFAEIVDDIATYVIRDLRHKEGGFYSAEDADSYPSADEHAKKEGAFYVWSATEIKSHLAKEISGSKDVTLSDVFCYHFNVRDAGNVKKYQDPHGELTGKNVLMVYDGVEKTSEHFGLTVEETKTYLKEACSILYKVRSMRPRPHLDDKIITAWNGLMISGLARGGAAVGNKQYIEYAADAAKFIERYLFDRAKGVLLRSCYRGDNDAIMQTSVPIHGFLDDYAFVVKGLLDLYEGSLDERWLEFAEELHDIQDKLFWDEANAGYFTTAVEDPSIILRLKEVHDGAEPSGNSVAAGNLLRLAAYLDRSELKDKAARLFAAFRILLMQRPIVLPQLVSALVHYHDDMTQIYIAGERDAKDTDDLVDVIYKRLIPGRILLLADHNKMDNILFRKNEHFSQMKPLGGCATAYVCRGSTCNLPVTSTQELEALLDERQ